MIDCAVSGLYISCNLIIKIHAIINDADALIKKVIESLATHFTKIFRIDNNGQQ